MRAASSWGMLLLVFLAGVGIGLLYAWILSPVEYVDTMPAVLRADYKEQYRVLVASSYAATKNLDRAISRLSLLGDADPVEALTAQAQRGLAEGQSWEAVRLLAELASAIRLSVVSSPSAADQTFAALSTPKLASPSPTSSPTEDSSLPTHTPILLAPPTLRPVPTPIPTRGALFVLVRQETVCNPSLPDGLLQVNVLDAARKPVPGVEIVINWAGGEEHFFTGLKPDVGNGYADFIMTPDVIYTLRLMQGSAPLTDLSAPSCFLENGGNYWGGVRLQFQQP